MKPLNREETRERALDSTEIAAVWKAAGIVTAPRAGRSVAAAVRLLLLLGLRLTELLLARWRDVDLDAAVLSIPAEHRKRVAGRRFPLTVPLAPLAVSILRDLHDYTGHEEHVFRKMPGNRGWWTKEVQVKSYRLGARPWRLHDLRRTARSGMGELGSPARLQSWRSAIIASTCTTGARSYQLAARRLKPGPRMSPGS
jgi:integrase